MLSGTFSLTTGEAHELFAAAQAQALAFNVPEPGSMTLLAAGLLPLARCLRRRAGKE